MNTANNNPCGLSAALFIAYKAVISLGYTHQKLADSVWGVNFKTLQRIRSGKSGKAITDLFYLETFLKIIESNYQQCISNGGTGAIDILRTMREILLAEHGGPTKQ